MATGHLRGRLAEQFAAVYLQTRGLKLLARNFRYRNGEIDLVMLDGDSLVFVEVRLRGPGSQIRAAESLTPAKQRHLIGAAQTFLHRHPDHAQRACRFDAVLFDAPGYCPQWIRGAFDCAG